MSRKMSGMTLAVVLGHAGVLLLRRCLRSVLGKSFAFVVAHIGRLAPVRKSVRIGLKKAAWLLPLAHLASLAHPKRYERWCHGLALLSHFSRIRRTEIGSQRPPLSALPKCQTGKISSVRRQERQWNVTRFFSTSYANISVASSFMCQSTTFQELRKLALRVNIS